MNESLQEKESSLRNELEEAKQKALSYFCKTSTNRLYALYKDKFQDLFERYPQVKLLHFTCTKVHGLFCVSSVGVNNFEGDDIVHLRGALRETLSEEEQTEYDKVQDVFQVQTEAEMLIVSIDLYLLELCTYVPDYTALVGILKDKIKIKHETYY